MLSQLHISPIKITVLLSLAFHAALLLEMGERYVRSYNQQNSNHKNIKLVSLVKKPKPAPVKSIKKKINKVIKTTNKAAIKTLKKPEAVITNEIKKNEINETAVKQNTLITMLEKKQIYLDKILNTIEENKSYPSTARRKNIKGRVIISMNLNTSGKITSLKCLKGHYLLCRAAINATESAQPYSALPKGMNSLSFEYEMNFRLK